MMKLLYKFLFIVLIGITSYFIGYYYEHKNTVRMEQNYHAEVTSFKDSVSYVINLTKAEIKKHNSDIVESLRKDFDVKLRNAIQFQNINTITTNEIHTVLKDSIVNDSVKIGVLDYSDKWSDIHLTKINDSISMKYVVRDSLEILLHKEQRNLWEWLTFKKQNVLSTVKSANPNTKITYNRVIRIGKTKN